jgi:outer membrane receptor for ferrienterochelin and colicins
MVVPHVIDPESEYTVLVTTPDFFELNVRIGYIISLSDRFDLHLFAGVQNIFNSFQDDFDTGAERDAGYVYGPARPRTYFGGLKLHFE